MGDSFRQWLRLRLPVTKRGLLCELAREEGLTRERLNGISDFLQRELPALRADMAALRANMVALQAGIGAIRQDIGAIHQDICNMGAGLRNQLEEVKMNMLTDYMNPELAVLHLPKNKKNVLIVGYYGAYNLGDEMMRQVIQKGLSKYEDVHVVVMLAETPECEAIDCGSADVIHYCRTNSDYSHLASMFDALIVGGGALIDENQYGKTWMHFKNLTSIVVDLPMCFHACGKPVYCLGVSTNMVLQGDDFKRRMRAMVNATSYFSVRDKYSYGTLREAGADAGKMTCVDDLVLCDELWGRPETLPASERSEVLRVGVVWISVIPEVRQQLREFLRELAIRTGGKVRITLIPFFNHQKSDEDLYREVIDNLPGECQGCVSRVEYVNALAGVAKHFAEQDVVVNLRYHAALVTGAIGINQLVVKIDHPHYENKMRWIIDEFGDHAELVRLPKSSGELADACIRVSRLARGGGIPIERAKSNRRALEQTLESLHKELRNV